MGDSAYMAEDIGFWIFNDLFKCGFEFVFAGWLENSVAGCNDEFDKGKYGFADIQIAV